MDGVLEEIKKWFEVNGACGVILPDGWIGRPFDSGFRLLGSVHVDSKTTLNFDNDLIISFNGLLSLKSEDTRLVLTTENGFECQLGSDHQNKKNFLFGKVCFMKFPG